MLTKHRTMLIVTDIQGNLASLMQNRDALYDNIGIMIDGIRILDIPLLWIEQYPRGLGPTVPEIASHLEGISPLPKVSFSSWKNDTIKQHIINSGRNKLILVGIETHICIYQTAMDLLTHDYEVHVAADCVSSRTLENKHIGLEKIVRAGGHVTSVETALFELLEIAEGPQFKQIVKLVK